MENIRFAIPLREQPTWATGYLTTEKKLNEFLSLPVGWHYGQGGPISHRLVDLAKQIVYRAFLLGFSSTDAFPGVDGGILITVYERDHTLEIRLYKSSKK